ncbi:MAG: BON domain-containing protein [Planctomycetales bacterium]|nr:BON domain-containing protein [Planctomycetales bacterium]
MTIHDPIHDQDLKDTLERELLLDDRLSGHPIQVTAHHGVVTLSGCVASYRRKLVAHEIVAAYSGVREVINRLQVVLADTPDDEEIARRVRKTLEASAEITKSTTVVSVHGGKVTLTGHAASNRERVLAEDLVRAVRGVHDVHNLLVVDQTHHIDDHELMNSVRAALHRVEGLEDADVDVAMADDTVVLSGRVHAAWMREAAQEALADFAFVHLRNEIHVAAEG